MFRSFFICLVLLFLFGCDSSDKKDILTSGAQLSKENEKKINDIDKKSYKEIIDLLKDNATIFGGNKNVFIIFGSNGCMYCTKLKREIQKNKELQNIIKNEFNSYYINISYFKKHQFDFKQNNSKFNTREISEFFHIQSTPTLVFLNKEGMVLLKYPGFISANRLIATLQFLNQEENQNLSEEEINRKILHFYRDNKI